MTVEGLRCRMGTKQSQRDRSPETVIPGPSLRRCLEGRLVELHDFVVHCFDDLPYTAEQWKEVFGEE